MKTRPWRWRRRRQTKRSWPTSAPRRQPKRAGQSRCVARPCARLPARPPARPTPTRVPAMLRAANRPTPTLTTAPAAACNPLLRATARAGTHSSSLMPTQILGGQTGRKWTLPRISRTAFQAFKPTPRPASQRWPTSARPGSKGRPETRTTSPSERLQHPRCEVARL
jgi:hypothetical protein